MARSWRSVVCQGRARDDPTARGERLGRMFFLEYQRVAESRHALTLRLLGLRGWEEEENAPAGTNPPSHPLLGASCRSRLTREVLAAEGPPRGRQQHGPNRYIDDITDPRSWLGVALSVVLFGTPCAARGQGTPRARRAHHVGHDDIRTVMLCTAPCAAGRWRQPKMRPHS